MIYRAKPKNFTPKMEVVSCFVEHQGQFLILHRQNHKSEGNKWGVPAGKMEGKETTHSAILRELKEETGIILRKSYLNYWGKVYVKYPDYDFLYHIFGAKLNELPLVRLKTNEAKNFAWVSPKDSLAMPLVLDEDACIKAFYGIE